MDIKSRDRLCRTANQKSQSTRMIFAIIVHVGAAVAGPFQNYIRAANVGSVDLNQWREKYLGDLHGSDFVANTEVSLPGW
jgi:hypothetical protein